MRWRSHALIAYIFASSAFLFADTESEPPKKLSPQEKQALFEKVFGKKQAGGNSSFTVYLGREDIGKLDAKVPESDSGLEIAKAPLLKLLEDYLRPEVYEKLKQDTEGKEMLSSEFLETKGLHFTFNATELYLNLAIDGKIRSIQTIEVQGLPFQTKRKNITSPSDFSAFTNIFLTERFRHEGAKIVEGTRREKLGLVLTPKANIKRWVLEGEVFYDEGSDPLWSRGPLRGVYDFPDSMLRFNAGDLNYVTAGFQTFYPIGGLGVSKNFNLQPYTVTTPISQQEFFLTENSQVEVWSNGRYIQSFNLTPGPYNLFNLPVTPGLNNVTLKITGESGQEESVNLELLQDIRLLRAGFHEYTYNIGFPSHQEEKYWHYDQKRISGSFYHKYGVNNRLSILGFGQGNRKKSMFGAGADFSTHFGLFSLQGALSHFHGDTAFATYLFYLNHNASVQKNPQQRNFSFGLTYYERRFALPISESLSEEPQKLNLTGRYSQRILTPKLVGTVTYTRQTLRDHSTRPSRTNIAFRYNPESNWDIVLELNKQYYRGGTKNKGVLLQVGYNIPNNWGRLTMSHDSGLDRYATAWNYSDKEVSASANIQDQRDASRWNASLTYRTDRFRIIGSHNLYGTEYYKSFSSQTTLNLSSALVYADGHFSISDPIQDSYAMVVPDKSITDKQVEVLGIRQNYKHLDVNFLGPRVFHGLSSYQYHPLTMEVLNLPIGSHVSPGRFLLYPSYAAGYALEIHLASSFSVKGLLVNEDKHPLALMRGNIYRKEGDEFIDTGLEFFTNRRGKFFISGIDSGEYALKLNLSGLENISFEIPKDAKGIYPLGTFTVKRKF